MMLRNRQASSLQDYMIGKVKSSSLYMQKIFIEFCSVKDCLDLKAYEMRIGNRQASSLQDHVIGTGER